jgi:hypothetical protein
VIPLSATIQLGARQRFTEMHITLSHYFHVSLSNSPHLTRIRRIRESEFYCDSELGTAGAVNPSNVFADDLSSCDCHTHAEEECGLGLYLPEIRHLFKRRLEEFDL